MNLFKNTSYYVLGTLLPKIGAFVFLPIYLKWLTPEEYGIVTSLTVLNSVLLIIFSFSLPRALYRLYYDFKGVEKRRKLIGTTIISVAVISTIMLVIILIFHRQFQLIYRSIPFLPFFLIALGNIFFLALHEIPSILLRIKEKARKFILVSLSLFLVKSFLILLAVVFLKRGALGYLCAELLSSIIFLPIYYWIIRSEFYFIWNYDIFKGLLRFSMPILPTLLSSWVLNLSDRIFLERFFGTAEVGIYSLGYQIAGLVLIFTLAFKTAYDPYFYKVANGGNISEAREKLFKTNFVFVLVLIFSTFLISFFSDEVIRMFFEPKFHAAAKIVPIISLAYLISQNSGLLNVMIYQQKRTKDVMYITLLSSGANILLNFYLIPRVGIYGAAWATVLTFVLVFIMSYYTAKKGFFVPFNWVPIISSVVGLLVIFLTFYFFPLGSLYLSFIVKFFAALFIFAILFLKYRNILFTLFKGHAS